MAVMYGKFEMPQKILVNEDPARPNFAQFIAEPFEPGFGHTLGNSMRRILLTSLEAPAIVSLSIEGVSHEFTAIEGIIEDVTNIVLNLKGALLRKLPLDDDTSSRDLRVLSSIVEVSQDDLDSGGGTYVVTLGDIVQDGFYEVVNPDLKIFSATKPMSKRIDLKVMIGRGYVPSERFDFPEKTVNEILIDASFSPVRMVNYYVEYTRVGQDTDFDRLVIEVETDGRVTPSEAVTFSSQIWLKHIDVYNQLKTHSLVFNSQEKGTATDEDELLDKLCLRIDEIELSVRSTNCLSGADINTIAELILIPEREMLGFKNFGKKSLHEIKDKLSAMGLSLGTDLSKYGITLDNVKEKMQELHEKKKSKNDVFTLEEN
ncbi:MAG: DNA-directed RNA polymerase subunit alpha [Chlamydiae bacterium]|nr:DNA-directed RNA polymerase subunit alpha [Chlamydiota bacterium]